MDRFLARVSQSRVAALWLPVFHCGGAGVRASRLERAEAESLTRQGLRCWLRLPPWWP